jgi:hypothetical protein
VYRQGGLPAREPGNLCQDLLLGKKARRCRFPIARQSGCDERVNQDEIARLDFGMIVAIFGFCNA